MPLRHYRSIAALLALCAVGALVRPAAGAEPPPAQGTRLRFQKTLFIHSTPGRRVFVETRTPNSETSLLRILESDYDVRGDAAEPLVEVFRTLNPALDPNRVLPGTTVRVPFKIEETAAAPQAAPPKASPDGSGAPTETSTYTVRRGDSLWRILKNRYGVSKEAMPQALAALARANPGIRDPNHLVAGQVLRVPVRPSFTPEVQAGGPAPTRPAGPSSGLSLTVLAALREIGCQVASEGETFLPLSRGRTVRLDGREFPIVAGPTGRKVVLDQASRLSSGLVRSLEQSWSYTVLQGVEPDPEALLGKLLPRLGFYELSEGLKKAALAGGLELLADARWTVVPREEDLWEGKVHFLLPAAAVVAPDLRALAVRAGYSVLFLGPNAGAATRNPPAKVPKRVPEVSMNDPAKGEGAFLTTLGIPNRVRPEVEAELGAGVRYQLRPEITFQHGGTRYAVPPPEPRRAEELLSKAGFFAISLPDASSPLDRLGDLLALLGSRPTRIAVEVPKGEGLRLRVEGLAFERPGLADRLYPDTAVPPQSKGLLTRADVTADAAAVLIREGYLPWVVRAPDASPSRPGR